MIRYLLLVLVTFLLWLPNPAAALEKAESVEQVRKATAAITDVVMRNGTLYGEIVNKSDVPLTDVRLLIRHIWLWNNEYRPGRDTYSDAEYLPVEGVIQPGESVEFSYTPVLPARRGGHFETKIIVGEFTELPMVSTIR